MDNREIEDKGIPVEHLLNDESLLEEEVKKELEAKGNLV
jgi:hypothetical protein